MQFCGNTKHVGVMIGNATDYVETVTLVFPSVDETNTKQCQIIK